MKEHIVHNCHLDYESYESSFEEASVRVLDCPNENSENNKIIQMYFDSMNIEDLILLANNCMYSLKSQLEEIEELLVKKI